MKASSLSTPPMHSPFRARGTMLEEEGSPTKGTAVPAVSIGTALHFLCRADFCPKTSQRRPSGKQDGSCKPPHAFMGSPRHPGLPADPKAQQEPPSPPLLGCVYFNTTVSSNKNHSGKERQMLKRNIDSVLLHAMEMARDFHSSAC